MAPARGESWKRLAAWLGKEGSGALFWPFLLDYSFRIARVDKASILRDPALYARTIQKGIGLLDPDVVSAWDDAFPLLEAIRGKYGKDRAIPLGGRDWADVDPGSIRKDPVMQPIREGLQVLVTLLGDKIPIFVPVPGPVAIGTLLGGEEFAKSVAEGREAAFDFLGTAVFIANDLIRQVMEIGVRGILLADGSPGGWCDTARERGGEEYETLRNTVNYFKGTMLLLAHPDVREADVFPGICHGVVPVVPPAPAGAKSSVGKDLRAAASLPAEIWKGERGLEIAAETLGALRRQAADEGGLLIASAIPADADPETVLRVRRLVRETF